MPSGSLFYRRTAGVGNPEYTTLAQFKEILGLTDITSTKQPVYSITLPTGSVADRVAGAVLGSGCDGWILSVDSAVNLKITHTLTGRSCANIKVWEVDGTKKTMAKDHLDAFSAVSEDGFDILIEGLDTIAFPLKIYLIFE